MHSMSALLFPVLVILCVCAATSAQELPNPLQPILPEAAPQQPETGQATGAQAPAWDTLTNDQRIALLEDRRDQARERLKQAQAIGESGAYQQLGGTRDENQERVRLLVARVQAYEDHISALRQLQDVEQWESDLQSEMEAWQGFPADQAFTIDLLDSLRDEIREIQLEQDALDVERSLLEQSLDTVTQQLDKAKAAVGETTDAASGQDAQQLLRAQYLQELALARELAHRAQVAAVQTELEANASAHAFRDQKVEFLQRKAEIAAAKVEFTEEALQERLSELEKQAADLQTELDQASAQRNRASETATDVRGELAEARAADSSVPEERIQSLQQRLDALTVESETASAKVESLRLMVYLINLRRNIWESRYEVFHAADEATLQERWERVNSGIRQVEQSRPYFEKQMEVTRSQVLTQERLLESWQPEDGDKRLAQQTLDSYNERQEIFRRGLSQVDEFERLLYRFKDDIESKRGAIPWTSQVGMWVSSAFNYVTAALDYSLFEIQEGTVEVEGKKYARTRQITVGKVVGAFLILVIGLIIAKRIARRIRRLLRSRFNAEESVAATFEKWIYYVFLVFILFFALTTVEIPLTIFAYLGGALAIGIGFGAQNLINNFISGLIMMLERPIKVGDLVEVEGVRGRIMNIGGRCSQLHRFDGIDMLIPNSAFLEKNVVNWTLSDKVIRFDVSVGVAYGSPTREVHRLILKAVSEHGKVLSKPEPLVVFADFGDSALVFTAYFWLEVTTMMDYRIVASDLRFRIDKLFREAGITIAFPQQDVHMDSLGPLQVRLVDGDPSEQTPAEQPDSDKPHLPD